MPASNSVSKRQRARRYQNLVRSVVSDGESQISFRRAADSVFEVLKPANKLETYLAEECVAALWRMRRSWVKEIGTLNEALRHTPDGDYGVRLDAANRAMAASGGKHESDTQFQERCQRIVSRAIRTLRDLRCATSASMESNT